MVRLWIEMFNRGGGIDALITKVRPGRRRKSNWSACAICSCRSRKIRPRSAKVIGPPSNFTAISRNNFQVEFGYSTTVRWLHELNFHLRVPQPWPERQNEAARRIFREELQTLCADPKIELWFGDESGIEGDPRPRRRWVQPGNPDRAPSGRSYPPERHRAVARRAAANSSP